jgi:hypothetical protein
MFCFLSRAAVGKDSHAKMKTGLRITVQPSFSPTEVEIQLI